MDAWDLRYQLSTNIPTTSFHFQAGPVYKMKVFPSFCFVLALTVTYIGVSAHSSNGCKTVTGKSCIFPFSYLGVTYYKCTHEESDNNAAWCATKVDENGVVIRHTWEDCSERCPGLECSCNGFIDQNDYGECGAKGKGQACFVNLPSSCTGLKKSGTNPGMLYSSQPCREIAGPSCLENNVNYPGHDLRGFTNPSSKLNFQQCRDHCKRTSRCAEWSFRKVDGQCWLKDPGYKGNRENEKGVISGSRNC